MSIEGTILQNTSEELLQELGESQSKFGKTLSKIYGQSLNMYTLREDPNTKEITVKFVLE